MKEDELTNAAFPKRLYEIVTSPEVDSVAWEPGGRAFRILNAVRFAEEILPKYFRHNKLSSFQRQLNLYGFRRVTKGELMGAYFHAKFQRDHMDSCLEIRRLPGRSTPAVDGGQVPLTQRKKLNLRFATKQEGTATRPAELNNAEDINQILAISFLDRSDSLSSSFDSEMRLQSSSQVNDGMLLSNSQETSAFDDEFWRRLDSFDQFDVGDINGLESLLDF